MSYVFTPTRIFESKACPGVKITFRKMTENRRVALQAALAVPLALYRTTLHRISELDELDTMNKSTKNMPDVLRLRSELQTILTQKLNPAKLNWAVAAIAGLMLGDTQATLDTIMDWPSDLVDEILTQIEEGSALSEIQAKNSESDTTSGAAVAGPTNDTPAVPVSATVSL